MIHKLAERPLVTRFGTWAEFLYYDGQRESMAITYGNFAGQSGVLCRIHSACSSAHIFNSVECDCREQMEIAQEAIQEAGLGLIIWLDQDGRGNGHLALMLAAKMAVEQDIPQSDAYRRLGYHSDPRTYGTASAILRDQGVASIILLSDSPGKAEAIVADGIAVVESRSVSVDLGAFPQLRKYYADKLARGYTVAGIKDECGEL